MNIGDSVSGKKLVDAVKDGVGLAGRDRGVAADTAPAAGLYPTHLDPDALEALYEAAGLEARCLEAPDPDQLQPGGLGVQLMHRAFDEVLFCPGREAGNCVILRARIEV